jgi:hypothetical protein
MCIVAWEPRATSIRPQPAWEGGRLASLAALHPPICGRESSAEGPVRTSLRTSNRTTVRSTPISDTLHPLSCTTFALRMLVPFQWHVGHRVVSLLNIAISLNGVNLKRCCRHAPPPQGTIPELGMQLCWVLTPHFRKSNLLDGIVDTKSQATHDLPKMTQLSCVWERWHPLGVPVLMSLPAFSNKLRLLAIVAASGRSITEASPSHIHRQGEQAWRARGHCIHV